jgi:hypothetical protein
MPEVPEYFSARRAMFISGAGRKRVDALPKHGPFRQVARADVEHLLLRDRAITIEDWDRATIAINHAGLAKERD